MKNKDLLINDLYISCKSYNDFYKKVLLSKTDSSYFDTKAVHQLNQLMMYNFSLLIKSLNDPLFSFFYLRKSKDACRSYEEINLMCRICPQVEFGSDAKATSLHDYLNTFNQSSEELICLLSSQRFDRRYNLSVVHRQFGKVTLLELVYIIISKSYCYIDLYKKYQHEEIAIAV